MPEIRKENRKYIGYIVGGNLKETLTVRLTVPPQEIQEGGFVVIESGDWLFYGMATDLQMGATDPRFADEPSEFRLQPGLSNLLHGQTLFTNLQVLPALMLECGPDLDSPRYPDWRELHVEDPGVRLVRTIPSHHAKARMAEAEDVATIFGRPDQQGNFVIGATPEQNLPICINLKKLIQRSSGIFGATGSGKSFLTRIILAGLIQLNQASILMFDMHNEYGFDDTASDTNEKVTGLRTKFREKVRVVGLGRTTMIRGNQPDFHLELAESDIMPEDIEMLTQELNLRDTTPATLEALVNTFGRTRWFHEFMKLHNGEVIEDDNGKKTPSPESVAAWAASAGVNPMAAEGLHHKLKRLNGRGYIVEKPVSDGLGDIIQTLANGKHVFLSFGDEFQKDLDYLLVTNLLTRRVKEKWEELTNQFRSTKTNEPRPLVIAVEEAHKLLNREMAAQTAFSTIAREMRKYYVTLLIIDQRPSQIYDEVMSQLGTRISGWLGDDADIQAVLAGLAGKDSLRGMLARLQPKEEVLLLGWGVPMPILVRSRRYDNQFWESVLGRGNVTTRSADDILKELGY